LPIEVFFQSRHYAVNISSAAATGGRASDRPCAVCQRRYRDPPPPHDGAD